MVDARGRRMNHGGREHATWSSPVYRRYVERIVDRDGAPLRGQPGGVGLADRQRAEPLRPGLLVRGSRPRPLPRLAAHALRHHRPPQRRLGHGVLVAGLRRLRPDRHPQPGRAGGGRERARAPGLPALVRRGGRRLHPLPGRPAAPEHRPPVGDHELHAPAPRGVPAALRARPRHRDLDPLSGPRRPRRRSARLPARRRDRDLVHGRLRARDQRAPRPDGAAAGPGELGQREPAAAAGRGAQLDPAHVRAGLGAALHLPLSPAALRQRAVPPRHRRHRRRHPDARRRGVRAGDARDPPSCASCGPRAPKEPAPMRRGARRSSTTWTTASTSTTTRRPIAGARWATSSDTNAR